MYVLGAAISFCNFYFSEVGWMVELGMDMGQDGMVVLGYSSVPYVSERVAIIIHSIHHLLDSASLKNRAGVP